MRYLIKNVSTKQELDKAYNLFKMVFAGHPVINNERYTIEKWEEHMKNYSDLMLYAILDDKVIGIVFGMVDKDVATISLVGIHPEYRNKGIGREMVLLFEQRVRNYGIHTINLGAVQSAEKFYSKLGYTGSLLIQSQIHTIEQLLQLNNNRYVVKFTNIYDGNVSQVCLKIEEPNRELQKEYESTLPGCYTQMMYYKNITTIS